MGDLFRERVRDTDQVKASLSRAFFMKALAAACKKAALRRSARRHRPRLAGAFNGTSPVAPARFTRTGFTPERE
jgi:hypothetical protein